MTTTVKVYKSARDGAVSIRDKRGREMLKRSIGTEIPMGKIYWMIRTNRLHRTHEHDFAPLFSGSKTLVCSCGAVQDTDGEVY